MGNSPGKSEKKEVVKEKIITTVLQYPGYGMEWGRKAMEATLYLAWESDRPTECRMRVEDESNDLHSQSNAFELEKLVEYLKDRTVRGAFWEEVNSEDVTFKFKRYTLGELEGRFMLRERDHDEETFYEVSVMQKDQRFCVFRLVGRKLLARAISTLEMSHMGKRPKPTARWRF